MITGQALSMLQSTCQRTQEDYVKTIGKDGACGIAVEVADGPT